MPKSAATLRPLVEADRSAWLPLWAGYQAFYKITLAPEVTDLTWRRFLDPAEPVFALGAFEGDRLVGIVHYIFHRSTWFAGPVCYLQDLFTLPAARGQGVGRALIQGVDEQAARAGARRVYWQTQSTNEAGRRLYDKVAQHLGFIVYSHDLPSAA